MLKVGSSTITLAFCLNLQQYTWIISTSKTSCNWWDYLGLGLGLIPTIEVTKVVTKKGRPFSTKRKVLLIDFSYFMLQVS